MQSPDLPAKRHFPHNDPSDMVAIAGRDPSAVARNAERGACECRNHRAAGRASGKGMPFRSRKRTHIPRSQEIPPAQAKVVREADEILKADARDSEDQDEC